MKCSDLFLKCSDRLMKSSDLILKPSDRILKSSDQKKRERIFHLSRLSISLYQLWFMKNEADKLH